MLYDIVRTAYYSFHLYKFVVIVASHSEHVHCEFVTLVLTLLLENFYCDDKSSTMIAEIFQHNGVVQFFSKLDLVQYLQTTCLHTIPLSKIHSFSTYGHWYVSTTMGNTPLDH